MWLTSERGSFVWIEGPSVARHAVWFKSLADAMEARAKAPVLDIEPVKIIEIRGRKPKGKYLFVVCWPDSYLARSRGQYVKRHGRKKEVINVEAIKFASLTDAEQVIVDLGFPPSDSPVPLKIYI